MMLNTLWSRAAATSVGIFSLTQGGKCKDGLCQLLLIVSHYVKKTGYCNNFKPSFKRITNYSLSEVYNKIGFIFCVF